MSTPPSPDAVRADIVEGVEPPAWTPLVSRRRAVGALVAMSTAGFALAANEAAPFGLIKLMAADLGRTESEVGLLVTAFAAVIVLTSVPLAHATRSIPRRWVLTGALGFFTVGGLLVGMSHSMGELVAGRVVQALGQSLFWAVVNSTAVTLFPPHMRGKIVARVLIGTTVAAVIGLPSVTRLGQITSWQTPFWVFAGLGAVLTVALCVLVPTFKPSSGQGSRGSDPHLRRFVVVLAVVGLACTSTAMTYTYVTPFFVDIAGVRDDLIPVLLLCAGLFGLAGILVVGRFLDRYPVRTMAVALLALVGVWGLMFLGGTVVWVAAPMLFLQGMAWAVFVASANNRIMRHSPGSTDMGIAINATLFNLGNAVGSLLGAGLLARLGAGVLPLASLIAVMLAVAVLGAEWRQLGGGAGVRVRDLVRPQTLRSRAR